MDTFELYFHVSIIYFTDSVLFSTYTGYLNFPRISTVINSNGSKIFHRLAPRKQTVMLVVLWQQPWQMEEFVL